MTQTQTPAPDRTSEPDDDPRRREYTWDDPAATVAAFMDRTGLQVLQSMAARELPGPPVMHTLAFEAVAFESGRAVFALDPHEMHYNPIGSVHGGVIATLLDSATGCAVQSVLPLGRGYTTVDLHTTFLRPVTVRSGRVTVEGTVVNLGSRTALAEARMTDEKGRLVAHATSTCLIVDLPALS
jgi:uncharacterized protein (TIGR00369 family)